MIRSVVELLFIPAVVGAVAGALTFLATRWWASGAGLGAEASVALLAVLITVAGWWVSRRDQRSLLISQAKNEARGEIVVGIKEYQRLLGDWGNNFMRLDVARMGGAAQAWTDEQWSDWEAECRHCQQAMSEGSVLEVLEQYELLFPATRIGRRDLRTFSGRTFVKFSDLLLNLRQTGGRQVLLSEARAVYDRTLHEMMLLEDVLIYVQNEALGDLVGRHIEFSRPKRYGDWPRMALRPEGLRIVGPDNSVLYPGNHVAGDTADQRRHGIA